MITTKELTDKLRAELRNGEIDQLPSTRQLSSRYKLHRNTCAKALQQLKDEGLINTQVGRVSRPVSTKSDPVDEAIDHLLNLGLSLEQAQIKILNSLDRRRRITVVGENKELIKSELEIKGFKIEDREGFEVSDDPNKGDFLLMLSNVKELGLDRQKVSSIGIVSKWQNYRTHIRGVLHEFAEDIIDVTPKKNDVTPVLHFCRIIICDRLIESTLRDFARRYRQENGGVPNKIVTVPYLGDESVEQLRRKVRCL